MRDLRIGELPIRRVITPEGVAVPFRIGSAADRLLAFTLDALLIHAGIVALVITGGLAGIGTGGIALSFAIVASFFLRNFYFIYTELRWGGQTIGKRLLRLRVISSDGGPLRAEAIIARNLTRDLEVFLPLTALLQPNWLISQAPGWGMLLSSGWLIVIGLLPLLNRDRLRCGDIVGGTVVVRAPEPMLLPDLATVAWSGSDGEPDYAFTDAQLDLYGIRELQVLEDVLRRTEPYHRHELAVRVSKQIREKIGWMGGRVDPDRFLLAFYKAQRARLEQRALFGERRERKRGTPAT